jgi:hypothetical protein
MLDIPHLMYKRHKLSKQYYKEFVKDEWYFDFAYHYAFVISVFFIIFTYSACAPLIVVFGFGFFFIKVSFYLLKYLLVLG